jgi:glyoxylate reductase
MSTPRIAVTRTGLPGTGVQRLAESFELKIWPDNLGPPTDQLASFLSDVDALLGMSQDVIDDGLLAACPDLIAIGQASAGYDNLDIEALTRHNVQASNCPGILDETAADFTWGLLLAACRRVAEADRAVRAGDWTSVKFDYLLGQEINGRTLGIIGYGQIGRAVARRAVGFGMRVIHASPTSGDDEISTRVPLAELYRQADIISVHTALTPDTHHLINAEALAAMQPTAVLVNTSRGPVVDEAALVDALRNRRIFAAGLDVFEDEPIGPGHPLTELDNVVLAPHIASASETTRGGMVDLAAENLLHALEGHPMPNSLTPDVSPRRPRTAGGVA